MGDYSIAPDTKNILIVFAHPERSSFNGALLDVALETLRTKGHEVKVSDLYEMKFNPCFSRKDIVGAPFQKGQGQGHFNQSEAAAQAFLDGRLTEDVKAEQEKLHWADLVIFQFPICWSSMPGILKGWFDRVFVENFCFTPTEMFEQGCLKGKQALLSVSTGGGEELYNDHGGPFGEMKHVLWPIHNGILRLCGFDILAPQVTWSPGFVNEETRQSQLSNWRSRLNSIAHERPIRISQDAPLTISAAKPVCAQESTLTVGEHDSGPSNSDDMTSPSR